MRHFPSLLIGTLLVLLTTACQPIRPIVNTTEITGESAALPVASPVALPVVVPVLETAPRLDIDVEELSADEENGDADDPAIWVHPTDTVQSLVVTVLKEGGLDVYDLDGALLQQIEPEGVRYNNVDLIYRFPLGGAPIDLAIASDRYKDNLAIFAIDPTTRQLTDVSAPDNVLIFTPAGQASDETTTAYGLGTYVAPDGKFYVFVSRRETGDLAQLELTDNGSGQVSYKTVRTITLPTPTGGELADAQIEGLVVDQPLGILYAGQENVGIWKLEAAATGSNEGTLIHTVKPDGEYLEADVEGLAIYYGPGEEGYLLVSSQGDNTFAVFTRSGDNAYLGSFQVGSNGEIDSVEECDGAHVINLPLGDRFPQGLLVVQDGLNDPAYMVEDEGEMENASTNFKFVPWESVAQAFATPLLIDTTSYQVR